MGYIAMRVPMREVSRYPEGKRVKIPMGKGSPAREKGSRYLRGKRSKAPTKEDCL